MSTWLVYQQVVNRETHYVLPIGCGGFDKLVPGAGIEPA